MKVKFKKDWFDYSAANSTREYLKYQKDYVYEVSTQQGNMLIANDIAFPVTIIKK